jgi:molybdopterin-guanine dinucleotide biosynthesis protein A
MARVSAPTMPTGHGPARRWGAVVLSGGTGARMGGVDKASVRVDGMRLLEHALAAVAGADEVVVVGRRVDTSRPVLWTVEDPPRGGPAAGLLAGLDRFLRPPDLVAALAVDMPRAGAATFHRLLAAVEEAGGPVDGAVLVDAAGQRQPLAAVYRLRSLAAARPGSAVDEHGLSMRRLVGGLRLVEVPGVGDEARDVDTWEDLADLDGLPDRATRTTLEQ